MLAISPLFVTALNAAPPIAVVAVCDIVDWEPAGTGPSGAPIGAASPELVPAAERRAPAKSFAPPALISSDGTRSALAYE